MAELFPYIVLIALGLFFTVAWAAYSLAPWVPSRAKDIERIVAFIHPQPGEVIYDLGCGDGRVVLALAKACPEATVIGVELAAPVYAVAKLKQIFSRLPNAHIRLGNVLQTDLSHANKLYMFVMPATLQKKLQPKFERELKPGTEIFSYTFSAKDWRPIRIDKPADDRITIYHYVMPDRRN